ncbi:MAG: hypothetical protein VB858_08700, partial [Planctomycetaceae bacterium]
IITDSEIVSYEQSLDQIIAGNWDEAIRTLNELPAGGPQQFLLDQMQSFENTPPPDWDGIFTLHRK